MNQQKIIWIINQYSSTPETGMGGRHYYLAQELAKLGYKIYVIAASYTHILRNPKQFNSDYLIESIQPNFNFVWLKLPTYEKATDKGRVLNWFRFAWKITRLNEIIKDQPNLILYSSLSLIGYLGAERLVKRYKIPLVFEVRDIWPLTMIEIGGFSQIHPFVIFLQWIENRAYQNSDKVISNLRDSVEHMVAHGLDRNKFRWIPNGYSSKEAFDKEELSVDIKNLIPRNKFVIGYTGSIGTANCLKNLIEAANILRNNPQLQFIIVGKGEHQASLKKYIEDLKLDNVIFIPPISKKQIPNMLSLFDVCYVGLTQNSLFRFGVAPNKLADYFCARKPIIYAIDSGNYKPILDAQAGYHIQPEKSIELANAIENMYNLSESERRKMGENGYAYAQINHEYSILARRLEKVFWEI